MTTDDLDGLKRKLEARERTIQVLVGRIEAMARQGVVGTDTLSQHIALEQVVARKTAELQAQRDELRSALDELKRTQLQLLQAQKLEAIGRLAAGVAHEINTPVQFVSDSLHFLRDAFDGVRRLIEAQRVAMADPSPEHAEAVARIEDEIDLEFVVEELPRATVRAIDGVDRVATLVRAMKEFAHPERKSMTVTDLNAAIRSTLDVARSEYKYVAVVETDFGELPPVRCHVGAVNQVVLNMVVNAAHAIEDTVRGSERKGTITVSTRAELDQAVITIRDTGAGIPETVRDKIFDPFFTTKEVGRGTGQGLAIARDVVVGKHGGTIHVDSVVGEGTVFTIAIPIAGLPGRESLSP